MQANQRVSRGNATKKRRRNPSFSEMVDEVLLRDDTETGAIEVAEGFHGRDHREIVEVVEQIKYTKNLAVLGKLIELEIYDSSMRYALAVTFNRDIDVCATPNRKQLFLVGGNQRIALKTLGDRLGVDYPEGKQYVDLGYCCSISYFADKHHLVGPKQQRDGVEYIHEFEENDGEPPCLVYDTLNKTILFVGGDYVVRDEGIAN